MVNHSALCRSVKYDYINILTWTILRKIQILNGCETFAFKYIRRTKAQSKLHTSKILSVYLLNGYSDAFVTVAQRLTG